MNALNNPAQIVFVTDSGLLRPTLVAVFSLARHLSRPAELHLWGDGLSAEEWDAVRRVAATSDLITLHCREIDPADLAGASGPAAHISAAAMGRLFIPRDMTGRVLYIDGDVLVTGDVGPLFDLPLEPGNCLGVVRDFVMAEWQAGGRRMNERRTRRLEGLARHIDPRRYFNSGVLLIDCDAIRAEPELQARMQDVAAASATEWGDQDHLNIVFAGRTQMLNPAYNSSWLRSRAQRRFAAALGGNAHETQPEADVIIHYHGPKKPWKAPRLDLWSSRGRSVQLYRSQLRNYLSRFPDLRP